MKVEDSKRDTSMRRRSKYFNFLYLGFGIPWIALFLFTAGSLTSVKTVLLIILVLIAALEILIKQIKLNINHIGYVLIFLAYCSFSLCVGVIKGYDFNFTADFGLIQYYFITPVCVVLLSPVICEYHNRKMALWNILRWLTCGLVVIDVVKIIGIITGNPFSILEFIEMSSMVTKSDELTLRVRNESSMFFLVPIYVYMLIRGCRNKTDKIVYGTTVIFGIIYGVLSGRKMLELLIGFAFLFSISYRYNIFKKIQQHKTLFASSVVAILLITPILLSSLSDTLGMQNIGETMLKTVTSGLSSNATGVVKRAENNDALIRLWVHSPIIGNGLNSYAIESTASSQTKWSYEVFYTAWLAQTGVLGMILLFIPILYIVLHLTSKGHKFKNPIYISIMLGFVCEVIGGGSNPLLYMILPWIVALSFAMTISNNNNEHYNGKFIKNSSCLRNI